MSEVSHQPCPMCGSSDAYSYNTEKEVGYCHSCGQSGKAPTQVVKSKAMEYNKYEVVPEYTAYRNLTSATLKFYDIRDVYSSDKGELIGHQYRYPKGTKNRIFPKSFWASGLRTDQLFGMDRFNAGGAEVVITEGELDAASAYQMLNSCPAVSLPSATPRSEFWQNKDMLEWLGSFGKIFCSFDSDGKCDAILNKLAMMFPNKVYVIQHTKYKDANEFLQAGAKEAYRNAKVHAHKYVPENMWNSGDDFLRILDEENTGSVVPTGIQEFDQLMGGLYTGYLYVFQAPAGIGKTELMRKLEFNLATEANVPIAAMHMEDKKARHLAGLASYKTKTNLTRMESLPDDLKADLRNAVRDIGNTGNLYLFEMSESDDPKDILQRIRYMTVGYGIRHFFFEPIQDLAVNRTDGSSTEQFLTQLSTKLAWLARELDICIITVAHENDDGLIRDCRMIYSRAGVVVKLERDKEALDEVERNTLSYNSTKNRATAYTGPVGSLMFDMDSFTLEEII